MDKNISKMNKKELYELCKELKKLNKNRVNEIDNAYTQLLGVQEERSFWEHKNKELKFINKELNDDIEKNSKDFQEICKVLNDAFYDGFSKKKVIAEDDYIVAIKGLIEEVKGLQQYKIYGFCVTDTENEELKEQFNNLIKLIKTADTDEKIKLLKNLQTLD